MKFGGTSVADADRMKAAAGIVRARRGRRPLVVVSALAGVTDLLVQATRAALADDLEALEPLLADLERRHRWALAGSVEEGRRRHRLSVEVDGLFDDLRQKLRSIRVLREGTPRAADAVLALGETLSSRIAAAAFAESGLPAFPVDAREVMVTDDAFGEAEPDIDAVAALCRQSIAGRIEAGEIPVVGGFVGATPDGRTTTLGRGGSDTSAAVLGAALEAEEIQIWTDVDGLMTADPRIVPDARTIPAVSFAEAAELAFYGARVLHPDSLAPAVRRGIPVRVANSSRPDAPGTVVLDRAGPEEDAAGPVVSVASRAQVRSVRLVNRRLRADPAFAAGVLCVTRDAGVVPDLVVASEVGIQLILRDDVDRAWLTRELGRLGTIEIRDDRAIVCVVGAGLAEGPRRREALEALARWEPELVGLGGTGAGLAAVVPAERLTETVRGLHGHFFAERRQR